MSQDMCSVKFVSRLKETNLILAVSLEVVSFPLPNVGLPSKARQKN